MPVPNDQHALVGQRDAYEEFLPDTAWLVPRVLIEMTAACQCQRDSQLGSAGVVHPGRIAQDHAVRNMWQEVLHPCSQGLYHLEPAHLADPVENLLALQVRQHVELDLGHSVRPAVTVSSVAVDM